MPWELLIALILAIGIFLTIKESREKQRARGRRIKAALAGQRHDEATADNESIEGGFSELMVDDETLKAGLIQALDYVKELDRATK